MRAYAHPATRPVSATYGRRYTLSNGIKYTINCSNATQHAAKRNFTVSRTQKDKFNSFLVKRNTAVEVKAALSTDITAMEITGKAPQLKARSRPTSPKSGQIELPTQGESRNRHQTLQPAQSSPNLDNFNRRSKSVAGHVERTTDQLLNPIEKLEVAAERPRPKSGCRNRSN